jgi:hypothetical protein
MATAAQILANRENAKLSTGPVTEAGKAAVARNRISHGLAGAFSLLPWESVAEFNALLDALTAEHAPATPTETFLVRELAAAQWRLDRVAAIEAEILADNNDPDAENPVVALAKRFAEDCSRDQVLLKLDRYAQSARRAWYRALNLLRSRRAQHEPTARRTFAPALTPPPVPATAQNYDSKPIPVHLERELLNHHRRNPGFDPQLDRSQMSKELRKWFEAKSHSRLAPQAA